jgi:hypothetical protein
MSRKFWLTIRIGSPQSWTTVSKPCVSGSDEYRELFGQEGMSRGLDWMIHPIL